MEKIVLYCKDCKNSNNLLKLIKSKGLNYSVENISKNEVPFVLIGNDIYDYNQAKKYFSKF